jgi:hypothetical protein
MGKVCVRTITLSAISDPDRPQLLLQQSQKRLRFDIVEARDRCSIESISRFSLFGLLQGGLRSWPEKMHSMSSSVVLRQRTRNRHFFIGLMMILFQACQTRDWALHKRECPALQKWADAAPSPELAVPSEAIRGLGRILWMSRKLGNESTWVSWTTGCWSMAVSRE